MSNTPLNANDELREVQVPERPFPFPIIDINNLEPFFASILPELPDTLHAHMARVIKQNSEQDRKKHELQARIDEAEKIYTNYIPTGTLVAKAVRRRIKKYKAALKETTK